MTQVTKKKNASFHRAYIVRNGGRLDPNEIDWPELLERIGERSFKERTIGGVIYEPALLKTGALMGVHKPINTSFMSVIDEKGGKVADLMDEAADAPKGFAHSTAISFLGIGNVFALSLGSTTSPRGGAISAFLDEFRPPGEGSYWKTEPVVDEDELEKLRAADGVVQFSSRFSTSRHLLNVEDETGGVVSLAEKIASRIGGDVEINVSVKLENQSRSTAAKKNLLSLLRGDLRRLAGKDSKGKARAVLRGGAEEELDLVAHNLAAEFEISKLESESSQFTELLQALCDVGADMEDRVKTILEG